MTPRICYTAGVWDLLHRGHLNFLWASRQLGDVFVVGVVMDAGVSAYKGIRPVENLQLRVRAIERLGFVDVIVPQRGTDPTENLERFRPDLMTHGSDWARLREGHATLERLGIAYVTIPYTPGISSTQLRAVHADRVQALLGQYLPVSA